MRHTSGQGSIVVGAVWMVIITLALFFLPAVNGVIGGAVGGYKVGTVKGALLAAVLPAIVIAVGLWILLALLELPVLGAFAGVALASWIAVANIGLFIGALIGSVAARRPGPATPLG